MATASAQQLPLYDNFGGSYRVGGGCTGCRTGDAGTPLALELLPQTPTVLPVALEALPRTAAAPDVAEVVTACIAGPEPVCVAPRTCPPELAVKVPVVPVTAPVNELAVMSPVKTLLLVAKVGTIVVSR